MFSINMN